MTALIGLGLFLLPFGLRIWYVERSMSRNGVRVSATCVDHIYEGNSANPRRLVCTGTTTDGHSMRWNVDADPNSFPRLGEPIDLVYDAHYPSQAERWTEKKSPVSLGVGWTSLAVLLIAAGTLTLLLG
ncbi:DUF3592 domain-containing protein [Streptomyces sp. NPDC046832]|uniref:DUF3592 domain-containing protein n=1 Tax=Streptomyces sp. NPDC046832 TaxID=3155020 RepID=UPI0034062856